MNSDDLLSSIQCDICTSDLTPHPLHPKSVAMTCVKHGDFFVYRERGKEPAVIFRPFEKAMEKTAKRSQYITRPVQNRSGLGRPSYTIRCDQTGMIYHSIAEAGEALHVGRSEISRYLQGKRHIVGGYTFTRLVDDGLGNLSPVSRPNTTRDNSKEPQPIQCHQTGRIFSSIHEAAKTLNIGRGNIYMHLRGKRKQVGGYTFTRVSSQ